MPIIENDFLTVFAENLGGELTSVISKKSGKPYLFNADKKYWGYHAPILFPIIGGLIDGKFRHNGKEYTLPKHGFARISDFKTIEHTASKIVFELTENEQTLAVYPFEFSLKITHALNENMVYTIIDVENTGNDPMYFSIGGHPALMCPFNQDEQFEDYYFEFSESESVNRMFCSEIPPNHMSRRQEPYIPVENKIELSYSLFEIDAIILKDLKSEHVMLKSKKSKNYISVLIKDFPYVGFWTKQDAPFICVEPWYGHDDFENFAGEFKDKAGIIKLDKGGKFNCRYGIEIYD